MRPDEKWTKVSTGERDTLEIGRRLALDLRKGDRVGISGPLGSGKTVLVRGICEGLGVPSLDISSPTFAIVNTYAGRVPVLHVDLYRVESLEEVEATGMLDLADDAITLIEWIDRVLELAEPGMLLIEIEDLGGQRRRLVSRRETVLPRG